MQLAKGMVFDIGLIVNYVQIAEDLVMNIETLQKMPRFTRFAVNIAMKAIRSSIKKRAKFDTKFV